MASSISSSTQTQATMAMLSAALAHDPAAVKAELNKHPAALQAMRQADPAVLEALGKALLESDNQELAKYAKDWLDSVASEYEVPVLDAPALRPPKENTSEGNMTEVLAKIALLVSEASRNALVTRREIARTMEASRQEALDADSAEFEEQQAKNEQMQQTLGCIGKVIGGLVTALSVVGAVFTGGATLAVAAVGLALMAADKIGVAITGESFIHNAVSPIVNHVLKPLVSAIGNLFEGVLTALGMDPATAHAVSQALSAVLAVGMMVGAVTMLHVGVSKLPIGKVMGSVGRHAAEAAPKIVANSVGRAANAAGRAMARIGDATSSVVNAEKAGLAIEKVLIGLRAGHAGISGTAQITDGMSAKAQADILAAMTMLMADTEILHSMMESMVQSFADSMKVSNELMADVSRIVDSETSAGRAILRNPVPA